MLLRVCCAVSDTRRRVAQTGSFTISNLGMFGIKVGKSLRPVVLQDRLTTWAAAAALLRHHQPSASSNLGCRHHGEARGPC